MLLSRKICIFDLFQQLTQVCACMMLMQGAHKHATATMIALIGLSEGLPLQLLHAGRYHALIKENHHNQ